MKYEESLFDNTIVKYNDNLHLLTIVDSKVEISISNEIALRDLKKIINKLPIE